MLVRFDTVAAAATEVHPVAEPGLPGPRLAQIDRAAAGAITAAIRAARFAGRKGDVLELPAPPGVRADRLILVGCGDPALIDQTVAAEIGGHAIASLEAAALTDAVLIADPIDGCPVPSARLAALMAQGARLRARRFLALRTRARAADPPPIERISVLVSDADRALEIHRGLDPVTDAVIEARDLVDEPANRLTPAIFVERAGALEKLGVEIEVKDEAALEAEGFGGLAAVGRGATDPPRLLSLRWRGGRGRTTALVGKGITFDTGGITLKPGPGMEKMKGDMAGGAAVLSVMRAIAATEAEIDVVGVIPLAANAIDGRSWRPGDVLTLYDRRTVEIVDTDAEGRIALADAIAYAVKRFRPSRLVTVATLTGSVMRALGVHYSGLFSDDDGLAAELAAAGEATGERLWHLPIDQIYAEALRSEIADLRQCAPDEAMADAIHAAVFLKQFAGAVRFAHLDIGRPVAAEEDGPLAVKGASGWGVRLFHRFLCPQG